jgi:hypothetical protein
MFQSVKRYVSLFILVGLISSLPVFANTAQTLKVNDTETFAIDLQGNKTNIQSRSILTSGRHAYRLNLKQGQSVEFTLRSNKEISVNIKSPSGAIKQNRNKKEYYGVITGAGEFVIEVSAGDFSFYTLEVKNQ